MLAPCVSSFIAEARVVAFSSSSCAWLKFEFSIEQTTSPIFDTPSIIAFRSASSSSFISTFAVKSFLVYELRTFVMPFKFAEIDVKNLFSSSFSSFSDGLFGVELIFAPRFPLIIRFATLFSSSIIVLSFLMPATTLSMFSFIALLISPNSSFDLTSSLLGAFAS